MITVPKITSTDHSDHGIQVEKSGAEGLFFYIEFKNICSQGMIRVSVTYTQKLSDSPYPEPSISLIDIKHGDTKKFRAKLVKKIESITSHNCKKE